MRHKKAGIAPWVLDLTYALKSGYSVTLAFQTKVDLSDDFEGLEWLAKAMREGRFAFRSGTTQSRKPGGKWRPVRGMGKKKLTALRDYLREKGLDIDPSTPPRRETASLEERLMMLEETQALLIKQVKDFMIFSDY